MENIQTESINIPKKKRAPSSYNIFVQEYIKTNPTGLPKERLRSASMAWKTHKESKNTE